MRIALQLLILRSLAFVAVTTGELYSAMAGLEKLLDTQKAIIKTLDYYMNESRKKMNELENIKAEYDYLLKVSSKRFQDFITNPINAFVLMKKLTVDWDETREAFHFIPYNGTEQKNVTYPDYEDLSGAAKALLRVQQTYDLETPALSEGKLDGAPDGLTLSADDCFELGRQAFHAGLFDYAISWLEEAGYKSKGNEGGRSSQIAKYLDLSSLEKRRSSLILLTSSLLQLSYMMSPFTESTLSPAYHALEDASSNEQFTSQTNVIDETVYQKLCQSRKSDPFVTAHTPHLRCRMVSHHPYLILQPVKEEELWKKPKVSLYHDIISDREIEIMKSLAVPILQRAEVAQYTGQLGHGVSDTRVTKIAWLRPNDHPLIPQMYRRIEDITGLSSLSAEPFQMANYGLGGHFHLHMDVLPDTEKYFGPDMGNRIATWLTYLSDVNGGGATVFPRLNLTVWPKKGSALFWHNVKSNGVGNILTLHGACPVVIGSKWITNVWFHERGQEFRLKCGRYPESSLQPTKWSSKT